MNRSYRQQIIDEYLNDVRRNTFIPTEFLEWLSAKPEHRAYSVFYGKSDTDAAQEFRLGLVRKFVSGLRIKIAVSSAPAESRQVNVTVSVPAFVSVVSDRAKGGGYAATDVNDPDTMRELAKQAATDIRRVFERHSGVAALLGVDMSALNEIASDFDIASMEETLTAAA